MSKITIPRSIDGEKLTKGLSDGSPTKNYVSGIEYSGANLDAIYFSEGRCTPNGASAFYYQYNIKDHLGNVRERFQANGTAVTHLENMDYYPFGMLMEGTGSSSPASDYTYNGKELNEDFGLNLYDYGARWYDGALGRWWSVDPMGDKSLSISGYTYVSNNPMILIDPTGMYEVGPVATEAWGMMMEQEKIRKQQEEIVRQVDKALETTVHVIKLKGADTKTVTGAKKYLKEYASELKLNVTFKIEKPNFDITQMSVLDAVAVVGGSKNEAADYILNNIDKGYISAKFQYLLRKGSEFRISDPAENPELTDSGNDVWGYVIATSTQSKSYYGSANQFYGIKTMEEFVAFSIIHGMGHLPGYSHNVITNGRDNGFMSDGNSIRGRLINTYNGNVLNFIKDTVKNCPDVINMMQSRFNH